MSIALRGRSALSAAPGTGPSAPSVPAGTVEGDVALLSVFAMRTGTSPPTIPAPDDWEELRTGTNTTQGTISLRLSVFRSVVGSGGLSAPSVISSESGGNGIFGVMSVFSGVDKMTPEDAALPSATTGDSNTLSAPSVTTVTPGAWVVYFFAQLDNLLTSSSFTNSTTQLYSGSSYVSTAGGDGSVAAAYKAMSSPGASGITQVSSGGSLQYIGITVPLRPRAGAVGAGTTGHYGPPGFHSDSFTRRVSGLYVPSRLAGKRCVHV